MAPRLRAFRDSRLRAFRLAAVYLVAMTWLGGAGFVACGSGGNEQVADSDAADGNLPTQRPAPEAGESLDAGRDAPRDAFVFEAGEADAWAAAGTCNDLISVGPLVTWTFVAQPPPTMTGGAIEPGIYEITKIEMFEGGSSDASAPAPRSETWRLDSYDGGFIHARAASSPFPDGGVGRGRAGGISVVRDDLPSVLRLGRTCPGPLSISVDLEFTFTGTGPGATLAIYFGTAYPLVETFTKR